MCSCIDPMCRVLVAQALAGRLYVGGKEALPVGNVVRQGPVSNEEGRSYGADHHEGDSRDRRNGQSCCLRGSTPHFEVSGEALWLSAACSLCKTDHVSHPVSTFLGKATESTDHCVFPTSGSFSTGIGGVVGGGFNISS